MVPKQLRQRVIRTRLEDLQAELEAGARQIGRIAESTADIRSALLSRHLEQAELAGNLVRRIAELQDSIHEQRAILTELRRAIREQITRSRRSST